MKIKMKITCYLLLLTVALLVSSCESYLDKAPEAGIKKEEVFRSFQTFQGFIEDAYLCMADPMTASLQSIFNFGDDMLFHRANWMGSMTSDYRQWEGSPICIFYASSILYNRDEQAKYIVDPFLPSHGFGGASPNEGGLSRLGYWDGGWLGIRKANLALENIDNMVIPYKNVPLQEQKNLLAGQAYMLRAFFYFHIIRAWGGMPYIRHTLKPGDNMNFPRLSYAQSSDEIEKDLLEAIKLLPVDWDDTATGQITTGTNSGRLTKGAAYALLGKAMLYAGSPLMNGASNGPGGYVYNKDYCKKAVKYLGEVINMSALGGGSVYDLLPWENYTDNFYMFNNAIPSSGKENLLSPPMIQHARNTQIGDLLNTMGGWGMGHGVLENYVQYFGMDNGENFDPAVYNTPSIDPFKKRDPRFYLNIVYDRAILMSDASKTPPDDPAQLYLGGRDRGGDGKSDTGYAWKKFRHNTMYASNASTQWSPNINRRLPNIRLADVYLMYAEAVNEAYGCNVSPSDVDPEQNCSVKAWEAVKAVRDRVKVDKTQSLPLPGHMYASEEALRTTIRRERAVELAFEGHRWYDLRRWYVSDQPEHMRVDVLDFDKEHSYFKVRSFGKKIFEKKHYWMPIKDSQTQIYLEFGQNPGW